MIALLAFMFFSSCRGGLLTAYGALGVADKAYLVPAACERVEQQQAPRKGFADAGDELDRFGRLEGADHADERREDAHDRATFVLRLRILGEKTVVTRARRVAQVEHGHLSIEADAGTGNEGLSRCDARPVQRVARREVVRAVENDVGAADQGRKALGSGALLEGLD